MRPTDENQQSTRPNLMSSGKRGGNEESILAMLERDAVRGGVRTSRLALYAAGGVLAVSLVGALAWLAHDQGSAEVIMAQAQEPVQPIPAEAGASAPDAPQAATIVDEPPSPGEVRPQDVPPLVLLTPPQPPAMPKEAQPAEKASTATAPGVGTAAAPADKARAAPRPKASAAPSRKAQAEPKRATKAAERQDSARQRPAARAAAAPTRLASHHAASRPVEKRKKPVEPAQPVDTVDSDVALISAVIQHATNRANAGETDCGPDAKCAAKTTPQP